MSFDFPFVRLLGQSSVILLLALFNSIPEVVMPSSYKTPDECLDFLYVQKRKSVNHISFHFILRFEVMNQPCVINI